MRKGNKVLLVYTQAKYAVHIHGYINAEGFICVRKKDTSMPERYDHVDVLEPKAVRVYYEDFSKKADGSEYYTNATKLITRGKAHVNENIISSVANAVLDLLKVAKLPLEFTQENMKALYAMGVR